MAEQDEGVPANVNRDEIKRFFDRFGRVVDVYAAGRKDSSGKFFALKRFREVLHTEILEKKMQGLMYRGNLLKVNLAKFERRMNESDTRRAAGRDSRIRDQWIDNSKNRQVQWANRKRHGRSFVEVVRENEEVKHITKTSIPLKGNMEMGKWLKRGNETVKENINFNNSVVPPVIGSDSFNLNGLNGLNGMGPIQKGDSNRTDMGSAEQNMAQRKVEQSKSRVRKRSSRSNRRESQEDQDNQLRATPKGNSINLNDNPSACPSSKTPKESTNSGYSCEIKGTQDIGKEIGFQFDNVDLEIVQTLANGGGGLSVEE
ncbi:hypothetical protein L2E82_19802 [Cichorium intybus]|uniref:Uncharacterized protein n=1 Tax=Cichorium intybus TaxID=13427 RepID=A0ACB9DRW0_CICIN|nr:hypothetical protein L2E82_19802 [Cichorium intybus]